MTRFEIYVQEDERWNWQLVHSNGNVMADGAEGYVNRVDCVSSLQQVRGYASNFEEVPITLRQVDQVAGDQAPMVETQEPAADVDKALDETLGEFTEEVDGPGLAQDGDDNSDNQEAA